MTDHQPPTPEAVAALRALDGTSATLTAHELLEDVDGAPMGVTATSYDLALVVVPWGNFGLPTRSEVYGPEDDAA